MINHSFEESSEDMSVTSNTQDAHREKSSVEATLSPTSVVTNSGNDASSNAMNIDNNAFDGSHDEEIRSPTSVTMVCSSSSATLLPTAAATMVPLQKSSKTTVIPKPFFVMDWLEELDPKDLELARQILNTPTKKGQQPYYERTKSTPTFRLPPQAKPHAKSNISLPQLNHKEDDSVCRQLYPAAIPSTPNNNNNNNNTPELPITDSSRTSISRTTSATSVSTTSSNAAATPNRNEATVAKMSPFKKRSIAIGNGWNAKGLHKAKRGSWESALACWENALEIRTQVLGETHPDVANTCNNIGIALGKLGRYDAAIEILERALELRAKHYGTREHVEVAATLHNIGNVLHAAQDCAGAIQCFWDAKLLQEQLLGPNHVQVARACVAIANVYYEAQQFEDAREAYYDALQIFTNAGLSDRHPEVLAIQHDLREIENICQSRLQLQQLQQRSQYHPAVAAHYQQQIYLHHYHQQQQNHPPQMS
jgi:tetratricopeptide (TPR) repeat protein